MIDKLEKIVKFFENMDNQEKIEYLISYADSFKEVPETIASKPYALDKKVEYCESGVYVWSIINEVGNPRFYFYVENPHGVSAKALCSILEEGLENADLQSVITIDTDIVFRIFGNNLSMGKNLGLIGIIQMIQRQVKRLIQDS
ncbi:MAG: SufE family protein [Melioribacteraceae bacterium]